MGDIMSTNQNKEKTNRNKGDISSYVKLFLLFAVTVFVVLLARNLYLSQVNYELGIPVISETIKQEIKRDEIYNYVRENPESIIYVGVPSNSNCRTFEMDLNRIVKKYGLEESITYLNLEKDKDTEDFFKEFNKFYGTSLDEYPAIIVFVDGNIVDVLEVTVGNDYSSLLVESFLEKHVVNE